MILKENGKANQNTNIDELQILSKLKNTSSYKSYPFYNKKSDLLPRSEVDIILL